MPYITKIFQFCAAHQYGNLGWDERKNQEVFGKDAQVHGHNYTLEVTIRGEVDPETGFVIDLGTLKEIVNRKVIQVMDHSTIEKDIPWFFGKQPSSENMVIWIWERIFPEIKRGNLYRIRLKETPTIYTDYYGSEE